MTESSAQQSLRSLIGTILMSPAAQKIDFKLDNIHVNGSGLSYVALALLSKPDKGGGMHIRITKLSAGLEAQYHPEINTYIFPYENYGSTRFQRQTIVHESVHALRDAFGPKVLTRAGRVRTIKVSEEAAAFVAGALFDVYDTPNTANSVSPPWAVGGSPYDVAYGIALRIASNDGVDVTASEGIALDALKKAIRTNRAYRHTNMSGTYANDGLRL